jgi:hypothetical protein
MPADDDDTMTWHDREVLAALRRLASARSRLDQLLATAPAPAAPAVGRDELDELTALRAEIEALGAKARARFGGGGARERRAELQARERALLARLGVASYDEAVAAAHQPEAPAVDQEVLAFARHELAAAEAAWREVQAIEVPDEEPEADRGDDEDAGAAIDLRLDPPAAS